MRQKIKILSALGGFTLIELLIVFTITGLVSAISIAGFVGFNQSQTLSVAASDLANMLNLAKSRALSQVKIGTCASAGQTLEGYTVDINIRRIGRNNRYVLSILCSGSIYNVERRTLPAGITFKDPLDSSSPRTTSLSYFFPVIRGGVVGSGQIVLLGFSRTKIVSVSSSGGVTVQ